MAMVELHTKKVVVETRKARVSDFSGSEIPTLHWQTLTRIFCYTEDGSTNKYPVFNLDLMPEELAELKLEIANLLACLKRKYEMRRNVSKAQIAAIAEFSRIHNDQ